MNHIEKLIEIFVNCDDFYKEYNKFLTLRSIEDPLKKTFFQQL